MKELRDIIEAIDGGWARGEAMALATIVAVAGSTYRREGAHLVIFADGRMVGNISGGCLEGDIAVVADEVMRTGIPRLTAYDLTADDDLVWGLGLGCNGKVDVFVEPVDLESVEAFFLEPMRTALDAERPVAIAIVLRGTEAVPAGTRLIWDPDHPAHQRDGRITGMRRRPGVSGLPLEEQTRLELAMDAAVREGHSRRTTLALESGTLDIFIEVLRPPIRLVVAGAGHDAIPVVAQAAALGWRVLVVDKRDVYLTPERFPGAAFLPASFGEAATRIPLDDRTAVVVMTHNYLHDRDVLRGLLRRGAPWPFYLGMLGPRARTAKMLAELRAEGVEPPPELQGRLYGPVGLDIGSEGPEEIALAVIAEVLAVDRARGAGFLRDRPGSIHALTP